MAGQIDDYLAWLDRTGQASWVAKAVRQELSHPNFFADVSAQLLAARMAQEVDDTSPVRDCILGTDIEGMGHTTGNITVEMAPSAERGEFDLVFRGSTQTTNLGHHGRADVVCQRDDASCGPQASADRS